MSENNAGASIAASQSGRLENEGTKQRYDLLERAETMSGVIALGRGDPDLPTPEHIIEAAKRAIDEGVDEDSDPGGLLELREAIRDKLGRENGVVVEPDGVVVTTGGQEGLFLLVQTILDPGDEIIVPDPRYTSYDVAIQMAGGVMVSVPTVESDGFLPQSLDSLRSRGHGIAAGGYWGDVEAIIRTPTGWQGVSDPRRGGAGAGY